MNESQTKKGISYAAFAFSFWGIIAIYWKQISYLSAWELLYHRVIWGVLPILAYVFWTRSWKDFKVLKEPKTFFFALLAAFLIIANWVIFIWAVSKGHVLEVSLGYFLNPLLNIVLGTLFLGESLRRNQQAAVALAGLGLAIMFAGDLGAPWISLALASSFALYGLVRKKAPLGAAHGLMFEMVVAIIVMTPFAGRLFPFEFCGLSLSNQLYITLAGPITIFPLIFFNKAVKLINYSTVGIIQYLAPTLQFLLAVLIFQERFTLRHAGAFALIWLAVALYLRETFQNHKNRAQ